MEAAEGVEGVNDFSDFLKKLNGMFVNFTEQQVLRSWCLQPRDERKARLRAVIELSVELARIRAIDAFATAIGESVIEDVIQGDWDRAEEGAEFFLFNGEGEELRAKYGLLWTNFVTLVRTFCAEHKRAPTPTAWWSPGS